MARVTVEDCVDKVSNRFDLVMMAAQRARNIASGMPLTIDRDNDKNPVVALREIADETVKTNELQEGLIKGLQRFIETDEPEEDEMDMLALQREVLGGTEDEAVDEDKIATDLVAIDADADFDGEVMPEIDGLADMKDGAKAS